MIPRFWARAKARLMLSREGGGKRNVEGKLDLNSLGAKKT